MALKGKALLFAKLVMKYKPEKKSNKEIALEMGVSEKSASAAGSRWARNPDVRRYIREHWHGYYDDDVPVNVGETVSVNVREIVPCSSLNVGAIKQWIGQESIHSAAFLEVVECLCKKLETSTDPIAFFDSVLINPYAELKEKMAAAEGKAKYTLAKPSAKNNNENSLEEAKKKRQSESIKGRNAPIWN